jgi:hypothetical protein
MFKGGIMETIWKLQDAKSQFSRNENDFTPSHIPIINPWKL